MSEQTSSSALRTSRLWAAFAVLPFADALLAFIGFPLMSTDPGGAAVPFAVLTGCLGLVVTIAGAIPAVLTLMKRGPVSLRQLVAVGVLLGNVPFAVYVIGLVLPLTLMHLIWGTLSQHLLSLSDLIAGTLRAVALGSVMGAWSALVLWFLGIRGS